MNELKEMFKNKEGTAYFEIICLIFISSILGGFLLINLIEPHIPRELVSSETFTIQALNDKVSTEGEILLGSGSIESEMYYYYTKKLENGGFKQDKVKSSESTVFYLENDRDPYIEVLNKEYKYLGFLYKDSYVYNIYLPEGSVIEDSYKVDF